jgi:DNA helicase-2/ATP-dependent DNA helicase PcrA
LPLLRADADNEESLEEERRLFYVGITRAEDHLCITRAQRRWRNGETFPAMASRFIRDLPPSAVTERRTLRAGAARSYDAARHRSEDDWILPSSGARRAGTPVVWADANTPALIEEESQDAPRYTVGERVRHARFGTGTIVGLSGQGKQAKARIDFDDEEIGQKTLMLAQAHLEQGWE